MIRTDLEKATSFPTPSVALQVSALQASAPIVLALAECEEELRAEAIELFKQLATGALDDEQRFATVALLVEILFPNGDSKGTPGLDLVEAEAIASSSDPEARDMLARMDEEESFFAQQLRELMEAKGLTQAEFAAKVGIGQPAISMMLSRACRPQRKTLLRFADALGVPPEELWPQPSLGGGDRGGAQRILSLKETVLQRELASAGFTVNVDVIERLRIMTARHQKWGDLGIWVRGRKRKYGDVEASVHITKHGGNVTADDHLEKFELACIEKGLTPWIAVYVHASGDVYATSVANFREKYRGQVQEPTWFLDPKAQERYNQDNDVMHVNVRVSEEDRTKWFKPVES